MRGVRDVGDAGASLRSGNEADGLAPPEPFGRQRIADDLCVTRRVRSLWHLSPPRALISSASRWRATRGAFQQPARAGAAIGAAGAGESGRSRIAPSPRA